MSDCGKLRRALLTEPKRRKMVTITFFYHAYQSPLSREGYMGIKEERDWTEELCGFMNSQVLA